LHVSKDILLSQSLASLQSNGVIKVTMMIDSYELQCVNKLYINTDPLSSRRFLIEHHTEVKSSILLLNT